MKHPDLMLLDCTLRDGGYYNDWDFSRPVIESYLKAMADARVSVVELGFRVPDPGHYLGPMAFTTDDFLGSLEIPSSLTVGVMSNGADLVADDNPADAVDRLYRPAIDSPVELVRIAAHHRDLEALTPAVHRLTRLGYRVGVNLMQATSRTCEELEAFGRLARSWEIDVAYFADSFGGLGPAEVPAMVDALATGFEGPVGCHMHDNMSMALINTLTAADAGATWLDGTIRGMGRGPGNARTEYLAVELASRDRLDVDYLPLLDLVTGAFADMQDEYGWGTNLFYFLSASRGVHPTYIQEMTRDGRYSVDGIVTALEALGVEGGTSFNQLRAENAAAETGASAEGSWSVTDWCVGKDVLVVGPGPVGQERRIDIERFIERNKPLVLALNVRPPVDSDLVDAYAVCHPVRAVIDAREIADLDRPVFMPPAIRAGMEARPAASDLREYGMSVGENTFEMGPTSCVIPQVENAAYAFAIAAAGGASRILLTGFDGFEPSDPRQGAMTTIFEQFDNNPDAPPVVSLTRTSYPIAATSLYSSALTA